MVLEQESIGNSGNGFFLTDFRCRRLTVEDYRTIDNLMAYARRANSENPVIMRVGKANCPYEFEKIYMERENQRAIRNFAKEQRAICPESPEIPSETFFDDLEKVMEFEGIKKWIVLDGGELGGEGAAYNPDGSLKEGWTRLCWK